MSRTAFFKKIGADFANQRWSWSAVNHQKREVYFGVWDHNWTDVTGVVLSESWELLRGRRQPGYSDAVKKTNLVFEDGYTLLIFKMLQGNYNFGESPSQIKMIEEELIKAQLLKVGEDWVAIHDEQKFSIPDEIEMPPENGFREGSRKIALVSAVERNPKARAACIDHYGVECQACDMSFLDTYGALGKNFIHVHHIHPLSDTVMEYEIDPVQDLIPLCPNCHAMVHRTAPPMSVEALRELLSKNEGPQ